MIVITGAAGFIGSCLISKLNSEGLTHILLVDYFSVEEKNRNFTDKKFTKTLDRSEFLVWFEKNPEQVSFVYHIGARTDTTEFNIDIFNDLNLKIYRWGLHMPKIPTSMDVFFYPLGKIHE